MACEYCEVKEKHIGKIQGFNAFMTEPTTVKKYEFSGYTFEIRMNGAMKRIEFDVESKDGEGMFCGNAVDINFCPMCGRDLRGDDK